jgi:hypothetical protein
MSLAGARSKREGMPRRKGGVWDSGSASRDHQITGFGREIQLQSLAQALDAHAYDGVSSSRGSLSR